MPRHPLLIIVLIAFFSGCSNWGPATQPDHVLAGIHDFGVTALAYSPDGQRLISGGFQGEVRIWDVPTQHLLGEGHLHSSAVRAILPLDSDNYVSGGDDGRLVRWQQNAVKAQVKTADVTALAQFQGHVVSGHDDRQLRVWSADTLKADHTIRLDGKVVALSANDKLLAVGLDQAILLLKANFETVRVIPVSRTPHDLQFSPDGRTLAAGGWFRLSLWDVASGAERSIPTEHHGLLTSISFSPDGRYLATLGRHTDSAIRVLDTADFSLVQRYQAHELCGAMIRYSPDGKQLASASDDESVRLYRTVTFQPSSGAIPSAH
jgi:WD40 repeat protein